jgi:hypothetical protein
MSQNMSLREMKWNEDIDVVGLVWQGTIGKQG